MSEIEGVATAAWSRAAAFAPSLGRRLLLLRAVMAIVAVPAAVWLWVIVTWSIKHSARGSVLLAALHVAGILAALLPRVRRESSGWIAAEASLARSHVALRALRVAVTIELCAIFVWPIARWAVDRARIAWDTGLPIAASALWIVWLLDRMTAAEVWEYRSLTRSDEASVL